MNLLKQYLNQAAPDGGDAGGTPAAPAAPGSVLASGGEAPKPLHEIVPEKYRVFAGNDSSQFDAENSTRKLAEGYQALAKRLGTGDLPPEAPDKYEIDGKAFGEDFDVKQIMQDEKTQSFLKRMHAKGATNAQIQEALEFGLKEWAPSLMQGQAALTEETCVQALKTEVWKTDAEYSQNMAAANRMFKSLPQEMQAVVDKKFGNDPDFIKLAAMFGKEMAEDKSPSDVVNSTSTENVEALILSDAYNNPKHPEHEKVSKQVRAHFEKKNAAR